MAFISIAILVMFLPIGISDDSMLKATSFFVVAPQIYLNAKKKNLLIPFENFRAFMMFTSSMVLGAYFRGMGSDVCNVEDSLSFVTKYIVLTGGMYLILWA